MSEMQFGVALEATIHVISDSKKQEMAVTYSCGINQVPTVEKLQEAVDEALAACNEMTGAKDCRLKTIRDYGFAEDPDLSWPPSQKEPTK